jgi:hypothetical protein
MWERCFYGDFRAQSELVQEAYFFWPWQEQSLKRCDGPVKLIPHKGGTMSQPGGWQTLTYLWSKTAGAL